MAMERRSPFRQTTSLREAMDRLFEDALVSPRGLFERERVLSMDVYEQDDDYNLEVSLPGVRPEDVDISVTGNSVTVTGQIPCPSSHEGGPNYLMHERPCGYFCRSMTLPTEIDASRAQATYEHGLLRLMLPKSEAARPRRIQIETGQMGRVSQTPRGEMTSGQSTMGRSTASQEMPGERYEQFLGRIQQGMDVCDRSGNKIGTVGRILRPVGASQTMGAGKTMRTGQTGARPSSGSGQEPCLQVDTGFLGLGKDLYVPASHISEIADNSVLLSVERDRIQQMGWDQRPSFLQE